MIWSVRLTADSALTADSDSVPPVAFDHDDSAPHMLLLAFAVDTVSPNQLLYDVASYNFTTFEVRDFDLELMQFGPLGLLAVRGFNDRAEAERYLAMLLAAPESGLTPDVRPIVISQPDFTRLLGAGLSLDEYLRITEAAATDRAEAAEPGEEENEPL